MADPVLVCQFHDKHSLFEKKQRNVSNLYKSDYFQIRVFTHIRVSSTPDLIYYSEAGTGGPPANIWQII